MSRLHYIRPATLAEALDHLARHGRRTKILAGGTDLVVDLRNGSAKPDFILDVSRLNELKGIEFAPESVSVGAGVTLAAIESSDLLERHAPALRKCAFTFASRQIRNVATIGGNVAHCSPCGDTVPPLVIHEARAELASSRGRREVLVEEIASGPYACSLPPDELILRFILKPAADVTFRKSAAAGSWPSPGSTRRPWRGRSRTAGSPSSAFPWALARRRPTACQKSKAA